MNRSSANYKKISRPGLPKLPSPIPLTQTTHEELVRDKAKLEIELKAVMIRIQDAREMGDLSENGAYKYGKFELGNIRRKLSRINHLLEYGVITQPPTEKGKIDFGSTVTVQQLDDSEKPIPNKTIQFQLVSHHESDPTAKKLSLTSPLGRAVMGKKVGDTIEVETPRGAQYYLIRAA